MRVDVKGLTKQFGALKAVDDLSFSVEPGRITGFLGPNGAGKTTTLRVGLELVTATAGSVTFDGKNYHEISRPMRRIGAALEASSFHPGRSALDHLRLYAPMVGVKDSRCREVLKFVGLEAAAKKPVGQFSLGMRGRLQLAATLLGTPEVLLLDEPNNGLDPEGIAWMRNLLRHQADQGCAVLVSSHMLSEIEQTVDDVVIIAKGRLVHSSTLAGLDDLTRDRTTVIAADPLSFEALCRVKRWEYTRSGRSFEVGGVDAVEIGHFCFAGRIELHQLSSETHTLESMFLAMTEGGEGIQ
jgi:ABC-2 type transport system ATP-binding protein